MLFMRFMLLIALKNGLDELNIWVMCLTKFNPYVDLKKHSFEFVKLRD